MRRRGIGSPYQRWQSYLFFHSALRSRQPGYITRIASCKGSEREAEEGWHREHIQSKMSDRFRVHFTPYFSQFKVKEQQPGEPEGDDKFFNKPFGLKHWMENDKLLWSEDSGKWTRRLDDVIILVDPDFLLLRPITDDFSDERTTLVGRSRESIYRGKESHLVTHGNPWAQTYELGTRWLTLDLDAIAGGESPATKVNQGTAELYYTAGPPYVATAKDMYAIAVVWSEFLPSVYRHYPELLAEMLTWCIAAAHLRLPHMLIDSMMVSDPGRDSEGWKFVNDIPADEVCAFASDPDHGVHTVPSAIHFWNHYSLDKYAWGKRIVPEEIFTCNHPLLVEPPSDLGIGLYRRWLPGGKAVAEVGEITAEGQRMEAFLLCALTAATNDAALNFKRNAGCEGGGNLGSTYSMWAGGDLKDAE